MSAVSRYAITAGAIVLTAWLTTNYSLGPPDVVVIFVVLAACAWYGGIGPAVFAPLLMLPTFKALRLGPRHVFDVSLQEVLNALSVTLITAAIGWSGSLRRRAQAVARAQAEKLREQAEALREADRSKDRFLATLAHELRNPLAPIRTGLEVLRLSADAPPDRVLVADVHAMMQRQVDQMVRLIDDLLDLSRINTGKIELRREYTALTDVIQDAVDSCRPHMDAAGHKLTVTIPPEPIFLEVDRTRISQVLLNLLNNAAKFTPAGGDVSLLAQPRGSMIEIRVRDTGVGISPEMLPRVFEMFMQGDQSIERSQSGLGIGLNLVRTLVGLHGGEVDARSNGPGLGSEFVVRLPISTNGATPGAEVRPNKPAGNSSSTSRRILVVDDREDAARSLAMLLANLGHECRIAYDGNSALEIADDFQPDVFILDIGMPGLSGYDVARRLREMPTFWNALLIAVSGWGQESDRRTGREAGFDHHFVKPVDVESLERALRLSEKGM